MPKSYLSNEPAVMRAIDAKFNPYRQVQNRLRSLELNGHQTDKIELIVMGGTFSFLPKIYQKKFITECFKACNEYGKKLKVKSEKLKVSGKLLEKYLKNEQKKNEKAKHRIIGLTLETRPDFVDEKEILNFRNLGCTRVELGVQSTFDDVLKLNHRGHPVQSTIEATKMLKDAGFKINYHMMPGLPGSTPRRDFDMFKALFEDPDFQPDMLKIYPTVVLKNSALYNLWKKKKYKPVTDKIFEKLVLKIKNEIIPPYVRISRLVRDVPTTSIIAGPIVSNLRQIIATKSNCQCIRCREVRGDYPPRVDERSFPRVEAGEIKEKIILDRIDYAASDGREIFLQYVSKDPSASLPPLDKGRAGVRSSDSSRKKLFALLRLRITSDGKAIIREVHTYGKMTKIDKKDSASPQHIGLGKKLLIEAEKIAKKEFSLKKISVISGVGVREYYRKLGYKLKDTYMIKKL